MSMEKSKSKSKKKSRDSISLFLAITLSFLLTIQPTTAWYGSYQHRRTETLNGSTSSALTNPVIRIERNEYVQGIYDGFNATNLIFDDTNCTNEIAVTDLSDNPIQFQVLGCGFNWAVILPLINRTASTDISLYLYYDLLSHTPSTFLRNERYLAEECNGTSLNPKWVIGTGSLSVGVASNGECHFTTATNPTDIYYNQSITTLPIMDLKIKTVTANQVLLEYITNKTTSGNPYYGWEQFSNGNSYCVYSGDISVQCSSYTLNTYYEYRVNTTSGGVTTWYENNILKNTGTATNKVLNKFYFLASGNSAVNDYYIDFLRMYNPDMNLEFTSTYFTLTQGNEENTSVTTTTISTTPTTPTTPIVTTTTFVSGIQFLTQSKDFILGYCLDNNTLATNKTYSIIMNNQMNIIYEQINKTCDYGCDLENGKCFSTPFENFIMIVVFTVGFLLFVFLIYLVLNKVKGRR